MLSLVIRGPLMDLVRGMLVSARAGESSSGTRCGWPLLNWVAAPDDDSPVRGGATALGMQ